jgi:hypothetical protein
LGGLGTDVDAYPDVDLAMAALCRQRRNRYMQDVSSARFKQESAAATRG